MTNGSLDQWDKTIRGKAMFEDIIEEAEKEVSSISDDEIESFLKNKLSKELFSMMKNDTKSTWAMTQTGTGYPKYWEFANSSIFVRNNLANFCTVSTSILIMHKSGKAYFQEQRYQHQSNICSKLFSTLNCIRPTRTVDTDEMYSFNLKLT